MWVHDARTLEFLDVNQAAIEAYGYSRVELLRMRLSDIVAEAPSPSRKQKGRCSEPDNSRAVHMKLCRKDGSVATLRVSRRAIDHDGRPAELVSTMEPTRRAEKRETGVTATKTKRSDVQQEGEAGYKLLFEAAPIGIALTDLAGNILAFNNALLEPGGYSRQDFQGVGDVGSLFADAAQRTQLMALLRKQGEISRREVRLKRKDGSSYDAVLTIAKLEIGGKQRLQAIVEDISQRRAAEDALRKSEALYRELFNSAVEGMFRTTPEGRFVSANPALVRMLGYESESELLSLSVPELYVDPELRVHNMESILETGELRDFEIHLKRRDGETLIAVENSRAIRDARGQIILYEGTLTDITERKRMEQALRVSEGELRSLFDAVPDLVLVLDKDGRYLRMAPGHHDMLVAPPEELLGRTLHEVFSQPKADEFVGYIRAALRTQRPVHFEYALLIGSEIKWFSGAAAPLTDESVVWVARDITPQKQAEEQVQRRLLELEALYESGLSLRKTLDATEISRKVIEVLSSGLHWHHAGVWVRRGDTEDVELLAFSDAPRYVVSSSEQEQVRETVEQVGQGMVSWVMRHGRMINSGDLSQDPRHPESTLNMLSGLYVPIWVGGRVLGCIGVESHQRSAFTEADERLLTTLATQAAAALENARLFAETRQRASESLALYEFTRDLTAQFDLGNLLKTLAERVASLLRVSGGAVYLYDPVGHDLEIVMSTDHSLAVGTRLELGQAMAGKVAETREPLVVDDYQTWDGGSPQSSGRPWAAVVEVPMVYRGDLIGVLAAYQLHPAEPMAAGRERRFTDEDVRLLSLFAASAAGAIYSVRLFDAERLRREEAETLRASAVQSAERLSTLHAVTREIARISQDPEEVYASIHQAASHLLAIDAFTIALVDERRHTIHGAYLFDEDGRSPSFDIPYGESFTGRVVQTGETLLIGDMEAAGLKRVHFGSPQHARSVLAVPLRVGGQTIGSLSVQAYLPDIYKPEDQVLLEMLGAQAAIAIQNARLYQQALRSAERQSVLHQVSQSLTHISQDPEQLYAAIHAAAARLMPADLFTIALLDEEAGEFQGTYAVEQGKRWPTIHFPADSGYSGWVLKNARTLFLADTHASTIDRQLPFKEAGDTRSVLMVPLQVREKIIGTMSVQSYQQNQYTEEDQTIFEMLTSQAAIAIQNARLFEETSRRAEEFQTLYEAAAAMSVQQDMAPLLEMTIDRATELLHSSEGGVYLYDSWKNDLVCAACRGREPEPDLRLSLGQGAAGRAALTREPWIINDYSSWDGRAPQYEGMPLRAVVAVPMVYSGELIGVLTIDESGEQSTRKFTEADERLLSLFATQAAGAIYNVRLLEDTRRRLHEFESLAKVSEALSGTLELEPLLENILRTARQAIPAAEKGTILLRGEGERRNLHMRAQVGYGDPRLKNEPFDDRKGYAGRAFHEKRPILIRGTMAEYEIPFDQQFDEVNAVKSAIVAPLIVKDEAIGSIALDNASSATAFDEADLRLLVLFASSAAVAIENARLFEETRRRAGEFEVLFDATHDISVNQQDLASLLAALVDKAARLLNGHGSGMYLYDSVREELELAVVSTGEEGVGARVRLGEGAAGRVAATREPLVIDDYHIWQGRRPLLEGKPYRALVQVPMIYGGELLGVLDVYEYGDSERKFSPEDADLLSLFASYAAGAVHTARLFQEISRRASEFQALYQTAADLSSQTDVQTLLDTVSQRARDLMGASGSDAYLLDIDTQDLVLAAGNDPDYRPGSRMALGEGLAGRVAESKHPIIVGNYQQWEGRSPRFDDLPFTSSIGVPMLYGGQLIGVLTAYNRADQPPGSTREEFKAEDASLLELLANYAAGAVYVARLLQQTRRRVEQLSALHAVDTAIGSTTDLRVSMQAVLESTVRQLSVDAADVLLLNPSTLTLQYSAGTGFFTSEITRTVATIGGGRAGQAALERQMVYVPDLQAPDAGFLRPNLLAVERFKMYLAVPLIAKGEVKGVLEVFHRAPYELDEERKSLLQVLAGQAALAIDNAQLFEGLEKANLELTMAYDATIEGWSQALELRDEETQGHSRRVMELTLQLAEVLGLPDRQMRDMRRGVLLHDIGKMGIPDAILHKPGPLTADEWGSMRQHPQYAYDMLSPIAYLRNSLDIPYAHHERWDGSGYPRGLRGETIPMAARIFSIVDVYDALMSDRPYRDAWPEAKVLKYIASQSGKHFDPRVVDAFLKLIRS